MERNVQKKIKSVLAILLCICMVLPFAGCKKATEQKNGDFQAYCEPVKSENVAVENGIYYANTQILLTASDTAEYKDVEALIRKVGGTIIGYISTTNDFQIGFNSPKTYQELIALVDDLQKESIVDDAMLTYVAEMKSDSVAYKNDSWTDSNKPEDTSGSVWNEEKPDGLNWWAEAVDMPEVWNQEIQLQPVKVGIIDTMFDISNQDLDDGLFVKTWNNPENANGECSVAALEAEKEIILELMEQAGDNQKIEKAKTEYQFTYHGTHVAGIIAAEGGNGFGITGINQNAQLYGYAMATQNASSEDTQWNTVFQFKCAVALMLNEGVKVINFSMGHSKELKGMQNGNVYSTLFVMTSSDAMESFFLKYIEAGNEFLIVKAAGNDSSKEKKYDAAYDFLGHITNEKVAERIVVVGAAYYDAKYDFYDIAEWSNIGNRVDVYAPGVDILSTYPGNRTTKESGTSMAAPIVTGLISLIWGIAPGLSAEQVKNIVQVSTSASSFQLDDKFALDRQWILNNKNPTYIVNANVCVDLAKTVTDQLSTETKEYGTVMGGVCVVRPDGEVLTGVSTREISVYDENDQIVLTIPLQQIVYPSTNDNGESCGVPVWTYSALLAPGNYTIQAEMEGYGTLTHQVKIHANDVIRLDFEFESISGNKKIALSPEEAVDIYMANQSRWMIEQGGINGYGYCLLDLDFDGVLELVASSNDGSGRYSSNTFYRINQATKTVEEIRQDDSIDELSEYDVYFLDNGISLHENKANDSFFYLCCDGDRITDSEYLYTYGKLYLQNNAICTCDLFSEYYVNSGTKETEEYGYYQNEEFVEVSKEEYNRLRAEFDQKNTNLNLQWKRVDGSKFDKGNHSTRRQFLLDAYLSFSYDGFSFGAGSGEIQQDYVTDAYAKEASYKGEVYNASKGKYEKGDVVCSYRIPQINLDSADVKRINREIYEKMHPLAEAGLSEISFSGYPETSKEIVYHWAVNDDILSLVVKNSSYVDTYMVYNISVSTGKELSHSAVIEASGLSQDAYYETAKKVLGSNYWKIWDPSDEFFNSQSNVDMFNKALNKTVANENIDQAYPYFNEKGQLCMVARQYAFMGADANWQDLNMVEYELSPYYATEAQTKQEERTENSHGSSLAEQYKAVLQKYSSTSKYATYDIDKDGVPELIVWKNGRVYDIYTFDGQKPVKVDGMLDTYYDKLYEYDGNGIVTHSGGQGSMHMEYVYLYMLENNALDDWPEILMSSETASYDELKQYLRAFTPIEFYPVTDYAYLPAIKGV